MKKHIKLITLILLIAILFSSCISIKSLNSTTSDDYQNTSEYIFSTTSGTDDLGRTLTTAKQAGETREGKYVGIFYFLWLGEHGNSGPYDNSIISQVEGALDSEAGWLAAGGGNRGDSHFWGKPLFDYYVSKDKWVMRKHIQMLTDADVDFLVFDTTNGYLYEQNALALMEIIHEFRQAGFDAPQVVFYTNANSGECMTKLYNHIYMGHPELSDTWFYWDGKPLVIGNRYDSTLSDEAKEFFKIKRNQWPTENKRDDGFPWMEFGRLYTDLAIYGENGRTEIINVSVAQHSSTCTMSLTAWYGYDDRTRSYNKDTYKNESVDDPEAYVKGINFADQFEWAIEKDPEIIFITGWNEWTAQRQSPNAAPIIFVDNADPNCSRDIEPMEGGYGDNYYMQMISYIRKFKGTTGYVERSGQEIDINGGFAQWNDVESYYKDYEGDTVDRKQNSWGGNIIHDESGRNDISEMKVCEDKKNVYFFVKTVSDITAPEGDNWMNLFISNGLSGGWENYNYVLNYKAPDEDGYLYLGKFTGNDYDIKEVAKVRYRIYKNMMMVEIPKSDIGASIITKFSFKWADNFTPGDVFSFYTKGDAAPIGRNGYVYG